MLKKLMILPIAAGLLAVNAGAACTETMKITTAAELNGFAAAVNGGNSTLCGVLANDIVYNEKVVNSGKTGVNAGDFQPWTPIAAQSMVDGSRKYYTGTFDGQGYTIYGLYTTSEAWEPAFIGDAGDGAVVKNLNIRDSYFKPTANGGGAAGIIGSAKTGSVTIDNCSFDGLINASANKVTNNGGLVGSVAENASLTITNSYNEGNISGGSDGGGLVGYLNNNTTLKLDNCYNVGTASTNPLVGAKNSKNVTIEANDVGCAATTAQQKTTCTKIVGSNGVTTGNAETIKSNYETNIAEQQKAALENLPEATGVTFEFNSKNILEATIADGIDAFNVPENIEVGVVKFAREFTAGVHATVMLPFSIPVSEVSGGAFYKATSVAKDGTRWNAELTQENTTLQAYTPYVFVPSATSLTFNVPVELVQTPSSDVEVAVSGNWVMRGLVNTVILREGDERIGKAYGYASKAMDVSNVVAGQFVKMGKNSGTRALRAYLFYKGDAADLVIAKVLGKVSATASLSAEELPSAIEATFIDKEVVVYNRPEEVIASIVTVEAEEVEDGEDAMSLTKPFAAPAVEQSNRWVDLKGRSMNRKPSARGVYINKKSPAVVK